MTTITRKFTKEQLIAKLQHRLTVAEKYPDVEEAELDAAIFKIALASLEAEPDYIRYDCGCCGWETIEEWRDNDVCPKCNHKPMGKTELFTAPPAPVVPDELPDDCGFKDSYIDGWNAAIARVKEMNKCL